MKNTLYLYNIEPQELKGMEYESALRHKLLNNEKLFKSLYFIGKRTEEEDERLFHVRKANRHTLKLLEELE